MSCKAWGIVKVIVKNVLIVLISTFLFLLTCEILRSLLQGALIQPAGFNLVKLATIFYVFPFYLVAVLLGENSLCHWGRLALFLLVSFFLWNKNAMFDSVALEVSFLLSFLCLLGLEKAKDRGKFRYTLFK